MADANQDEIIEKMHEHYKAIVMPVCSNCSQNSNVIPCVFGMPDKELG